VLTGQVYPEVRIDRLDTLPHRRIGIFDVKAALSRS
jgi:hypothetical protein